MVPYNNGHLLYDGIQRHALSEDFITVYFFCPRTLILIYVFHTYVSVLHGQSPGSITMAS